MLTFTVSAVIFNFVSTYRSTSVYTSLFSLQVTVTFFLEGFFFGQWFQKIENFYFKKLKAPPKDMQASLDV